MRFSISQTINDGDATERLCRRTPFKLRTPQADRLGGIGSP
jgi:hypothetical protein